MAFFPNCSGLIINGGNFTSFQTEDAAATQVLGKRKRQDSECDSFRRHRSLDSDGLMILKAGDVELRRELISDGDNSYRIHAASHGGRLVAVKTFEGPRAKQDWKVNVAFSETCFHPNVLQIVGISDESSKSHFIQFRGITSEQKMQGLIANALGTDLNTSVQLSMKAVKGIAAGLSYIKSQKIPIMYAGTMNNNEKWDNFDILTGYDNEPIIAFHLSSTEDGSVSQNLDIKTDSRGIEVLNGLCDQLFSGAHSILYDDSPEREFDVYGSEGLPAATLEQEGSNSNLSESKAISNSSTPTENPKPSRKPRREVWWLDLGAANHSLKSIRRCFEDRLNWSLLSSSNSLLRHIRSPKDDNLRRNLHQCPGYLREEITLTCDLSKSVIVSHAFPGLSERCSICHQLVQYTYSESFDYDSTISYYRPTQNNSLSLPPTEGALTFDHLAPVGGIDPFTPNIGVKSSDASSVMNGLFQPSPFLSEDAQSTLQSTADPNILQDLRLSGLRMAQFQQNLGVDSDSGQTPSSSTSHMDAANQQTQRQDTGVPGFQWIVDETRPAVSFPSRSHAQSSSAGSRSMSESSPTREQQLPAQDSLHEMKINKKEAELLRPEKRVRYNPTARMARKQREQAQEASQLTKKTTVACNFCRSRKLKCDGASGRPVCSQCLKRSNPCDYMPQNKRRGTLRQRNKGEDSESDSGDYRSPEGDESSLSPEIVFQPLSRRSSNVGKHQVEGYSLPSMSALNNERREEPSTPSSSRPKLNQGMSSSRTSYFPNKEVPHIATLGPSSSATGMPRETREQRQQRMLAQMEQRQREEVAHLHRAMRRALQMQPQAEQPQQYRSSRAFQRQDRYSRMGDDQDDSFYDSVVQPSNSNSDTDV